MIEGFKNTVKFPIIKKLVIKAGDFAIKANGFYGLDESLKLNIIMHADKNAQRPFENNQSLHGGSADIH